MTSIAVEFAGSSGVGPSHAMTSVPMNENGAALYTCLSCSIAFASPEDQRIHYRSDFHRYNMKRRIAGLAPVRADIFNEKILERRVQEEQEASAAGSSKSSTQDRCRACNKTFNSKNAFESHLNSKKHKEAEQKLKGPRDEVHQPTSAADSLIVRIPPEPVEGLGNVNDLADSLPSVQQTYQTAKHIPPVTLQVKEDATEEEIAKAIDDKVASSRRINPKTSCIFCSASGFKDLEESLRHMSSQHGFFLPEKDFLVDQSGLMEYLSDKICVGNICLYCNGKGRGFASSEAVRKHMIDKSHCKVAYDLEEDKLELGDFYDFTSSYPDAQWEDVDNDDDDDNEEHVGEVAWDSASDNEDDEAIEGTVSGLRYGDNEFELVLPSGARLGHRSLRRYYKQSLRPSSNSASLTSGSQIAHRLNAPPARRDLMLVEGRNGQMFRARNRGEAREAKKHISTYRDVVRREHFKTQIGYRNNNQKHFRDPLLQ